MKKALFLSFLVAALIHAQEFSGWKLFTSMNKVNDLTGYANEIWCATEGGIFKYNVLNGEYAGYHKEQGLINHDISSIEVDDEGNIWFGDTKGIVSKIEAGTENILTNMDIYNSGKTNKRINNISFSADTVIVSTGFGVVLINRENLDIIDSFVKLGDFQSDEEIISAVMEKNRFYVVTGSGLAVSKQGKPNLVSPDNWDSFPTGIKFNDIAFFDGKILLLTGAGLYRFENSSFIKDGLEGKNLNDFLIVENKLYFLSQSKVEEYKGNFSISVPQNNNGMFTFLNNNFYLATDNGVFESENGKYIMPDGPASNSYLSLTVSNNGNLFVGTGINGRGKGIMALIDNRWNLLDKVNYPELRNNDYYKVSAGLSGRAFFASWGFGFAIFENGKLNHYDTGNTPMKGIPNDNNFLVVADMEEDLNGNLWILNYLPGDNKNLTVLTKENDFVAIEPNDISIKNKLLNAKELVIDQLNNKWFFTDNSETGSTGKGLYRFNDNNTIDNFNDDKWDYFTSANGLSSSDITAIAVDIRGELWIATLNGLNYVSDPGRTNPIFSKVFGAGTILRNQNIRVLIADALNRKWVGTDEGILIFNEDCSKLLFNLNSENSLLPDNTIYSIAIDPNSGIAYVGSQFGLTLFKTNSVNPVIEFDELSIYPNPVKIKNGTNKVFIDGLVRDSKIKIISVSGNLIAEFETPGGRLASWDLKDSSGNKVSSGIYLIVAYDEEGNNVATAKVAVIR